jgi:hypothetical protein
MQDQKTLANQYLARPVETRHNPKVAGPNPAPAIPADKAKGSQKSCKPADRDPEGHRKVAFVVEGVVASFPEKQLRAVGPTRGECAVNSDFSQPRGLPMHSGTVALALAQVYDRSRGRKFDRRIFGDRGLDRRGEHQLWVHI